MGKIRDWSESATRTVVVYVEGLDPCRGAGEWEIIPEIVTIWFVRESADAPEKIHKVEIRGERVVNPGTGYKGYGLAAFYRPEGLAEAPGWVRSLVELYESVKGKDKAARLNACRIAVEWFG